MNLWADTTKSGETRTKANTSFTKWRLLVVEAISSLTGAGDQDSANRVAKYGLEQFGLAYDDHRSVEDMARELAQ